MRSQLAISCEERNNLLHGGIRYLPYAFTEHGVMMLSGLLKSDVAIKVNIQIIDFKFLYHCGSSFKDLDKKCFAITKIEDNDYLSELLKKK